MGYPIRRQIQGVSRLPLEPYRRDGRQFFFSFLVEFAGDLSPRRQEEEEEEEEEEGPGWRKHFCDFAGSSSVAPPGFLSNLAC